MPFTLRGTACSFAVLVSALIISSSAVARPAIPPSVHLEAEDAQLTGATVTTEVKGYSGRGYVTGFTHDGDKAVFTFDAKAGLYDLELRYRAANGEKQCDLSINGTHVSGTLPRTAATAFATVTLGKVELTAGRNTLSIEKGWGWYDVDAVDLIPSKLASPPRRPPRTLTDPHATRSARALFNRLIDLYGVKTLSGQMNVAEADYIHEVTGKYPAIIGFDLMDFSATRQVNGAHPQGSTEKTLQAVRQRGRVLTLMWHWNAPADLLDTPEHRWWSGFYTNATTFDLAATLDHPESERYRLLIADMDRIAEELKKVAAANVPVLWRPLHEAEGGWFWWGAKGPAPFKRLWRLMYNRFTRHHSLHNLIWVYSSGTDPGWYPGDAYVDIVGIDAYPSDYTDPLTGNWEKLRKRFDGRKLLALTEFGKVPDIEKMRRFDVYWSYFASWNDKLGPKGISPSELKRLYAAPSVLNRLAGN